VRDQRQQDEQLRREQHRAGDEEERRRVKDLVPDRVEREQLHE
jgi:hypothetical protein